MAVHEIFPYLCVADTNAAIDFYTRAFGAREKFRLSEPHGRIGHAELDFGGMILMLCDEFPEYGIRSAAALGGTPVTIHLHVDDADATIRAAVEAGAALESAPQDQFYGERAGSIHDPFGHRWLIGHEIERVTPQEMQRRYTALFEKVRLVEDGGRSESVERAATIEPPEIVETEARPAAVVHMTVPRDAMRRAFGPAVAELLNVLAAQGIETDGPVFARHLKLDPEHFEFQLGVPVVSPVTTGGPVEPGELPAGTVARTIYHGPHAGLLAAWARFTQWIADAGHEPAPDRWECYIVHPESEADPDAWRTQLNRPLIR